MKKLYLLGFLILLALPGFCELPPWVQPQIDTSYSRLAKDNIELRIEVDRLKDMNQKQFDGISTQITVASWLLGIVAFIVSVGGLLLAYSINKTFEKIEVARGIMLESEQRSDASRVAAEEASIKAQVAEAKAEEFFNNIQHNIKNVYTAIKRVELETNMKTIDDNPSKFDSYYHSLRDSEFEPSDYEWMKVHFIRHLSAKHYITSHPHLLLLRDKFPTTLATDSYIANILFSQLKEDLSIVPQVETLMNALDDSIFSYDALKDLLVKHDEDNASLKQDSVALFKYTESRYRDQFQEDDTLIILFCKKDKDGVRKQITMAFNDPYYTRYMKILANNGEVNELFELCQLPVLDTENLLDIANSPDVAVSLLNMFMNTEYNSYEPYESRRDMSNYFSSIPGGSIQINAKLQGEN